MKVAGLSGGVGGAKLLGGLQDVLEPGELTAIVNTADDAVVYGLQVCPDIDIVTYWLAGRADTERGWGVAGDSFRVVDTLGGLGLENWFRLGDVDLATCLFRTQALAAGRGLAEVTDDVRRSLGVPSSIVPMTDDRVATKMVARDGRVLDFQEYFVKERTRVDVVEVLFEGIGLAKPSQAALDAIEEAAMVVICPSNPIVSIGPILALPDIRDALRRHPRVVAITPIVGGRALKGPADRLLEALGHGSSAAAVARMYSDLCDVFVVDASDRGMVDEAKASVPVTAALDTIMTDRDAARRLASQLLSS